MTCSSAANDGRREPIKAGAVATAEPPADLPAVDHALAAFDSVTQLHPDEDVRRGLRAVGARALGASAADRRLIRECMLDRLALVRDEWSPKRREAEVDACLADPPHTADGRVCSVAGAKQPLPGAPEHSAADGDRHTTDPAASEPDVAWPEPSDLPGLPSVPAWDDALFPDALRPWLSDVAERIQCPREYVAVPAVVALASAIGRGCAIRPKRRDEWIVVPNLFGAIIGPPAAMKSPALSEGLRPLRSVATEASERYGQLAGEREELEARLSSAKKALHTAAAKGDDTSELRDRYQELSRLMAAAGRERRYIVYDTTTEKLGEILNASPRGVLLVRDELSGWFASLERQGHESDRAFFLEAWNGTGEFIYDRITRGTIRIESACVSIVGGIQPGPLERYLRDAVTGGAGADGFMQRFQLLVYPESPRTWRNVDRWPDSAARQQAFELYRRVAELTPEDVGADASDGIPFLRFDAEAQEFFDGWYAELMTRVRSGTEHEAIEGHLIKYSSLMPSLALIFQLADHGRGPVGLTAAQRAAAWCSFLEAHARRVYATVTDSAADAARTLLSKIRAGKLGNPFRAQDVYLSGWTGLATTDEAHRAIELLEGHGYVRQVQVQTNGRPRTDIFVHPALTRKEAA